MTSMNPYAEEEAKKKQENTENRIETRSQFMGPLHAFLFVMALVIAFAIILLCSTSTTPMLIYDESEVYSCPHEWLGRESMANLTSEEESRMHLAFNRQPDKKIYHEAFALNAQEDMFYNPNKCKPLYQNSNEPIWYGRVEDMNPINQHIIVYGFITLDAPTKELFDEEVDKLFDVSYHMSVRGKNKDQFEWTYFEKHENTVVAKCDSNDFDICTYFPVGFVPFIQFDMYDVGIEILPSTSLNALHLVHLDFHIAYFNPAFTEEQLALKLIFTWYTLLTLLAYSAKVIYLLAVKGADATRFPVDIWWTWALLFLLVCFDDPSYQFHVEDPNFITYFISEFGIALFIAGLLIFWIRDIAKHRAKKLEEDASKLQKFLHSSMAMSQKALCFLVMWYGVMVATFMILYCTFYTAIEGNPGDGEISINQKIKNPQLKFALGLTYVVLALYYLYYFISLCNNLRLIVELEKSQVIVFCFSQVFHFIFICAALLGVFSRHFENGGIQVFFYATCNLYIYILAYLNWPVVYFFREFDIDENVEISLDNDGNDKVDNQDVVSPQQIELEDQNAGEQPKNFAINEEEKSSDRGSVGY